MRSGVRVVHLVRICVRRPDDEGVAMLQELLRSPTPPPRPRDSTLPWYHTRTGHERGGQAAGSGADTTASTVPAWGGGRSTFCPPYDRIGPGVWPHLLARPGQQVSTPTCGPARAAAGRRGERTRSVSSRASQCCRRSRFVSYSSTHPKDSTLSWYCPGSTTGAWGGSQGSTVREGSDGAHELAI